MKKEQRSQELYRLVYQCEELKAKGCNYPCAKCPLYLPNYASFYNEDQCNIALIQTSAAIDFKKTQQFFAQERLATIVKAIIYICIGIWAFISLRNCVTPSQKPLPVSKIVDEQGYNPITVQYDPFIQQIAPTQMIIKRPSVIDEGALYQHLRNVKAKLCDINGDGLINCIDYAVLFYLEAGPNTQIIQNRNPNTGMNHLFNAMRRPGGGWTYIEPQSNPGTMATMEAVWGSSYNATYNFDVTNDYVRLLGIVWQ